MFVQKDKMKTIAVVVLIFNSIALGLFSIAYVISRMGNDGFLALNLFSFRLQMSWDSRAMPFATIGAIFWIIAGIMTIIAKR